MSPEPTAANPWSGTPQRPPYVLPDDNPYVDAWNHVHAGKGGVVLRTDLLPEPCAGPRDASVVLLSLNPGYSDSDLADQARPRLQAMIRGNLGDDPAQHVHPYLLDEFADTAGGEWARRCWAAVERTGIDYEDIARRVLSVEFHGYHSTGAAVPPVTLPSQHFGFGLVRVAIARGALIVLSRGSPLWLVAVPELNAYPRVLRPNSVRRTTISPGNLGEQSFPLVLRALGSG